MKKIYVVGIGPGSCTCMTSQAREALEDADVIAGYKTYTDIVAPLYPSKKVYENGMTQEEDRCRWVLEQASQGKTVALVSSGDAGVYGMASLVYELSADYCDVEIEIISGVTAALSGAALLGAPLANDFAVISLSNLLTPQNIIEKRLHAAALGDFCIALYNPASHRRTDTLKNACAILMETMSADTPCGWVKNIGREGTEVHVCTLKELSESALDMFCTAFIGNSTTKIVACTRRSDDGSVVQQKKLVTPRGYTSQS
jgi:precorrin-3B C17-methyltransferase